MSNTIEPSTRIAGERGAQSDKVSSAAQYSKIPLPPELLQTILQSDVLSKRDVLQVRSVSKQWKDAADESTLPDFRVPTTCLTGKGHRKSRATVSAFLQASRESDWRKTDGAVFRRKVPVGQYSALIHDQTQTALIRCGNGRLVEADLNSSSSIFSEIAKSGSIEGGRKIMRSDISTWKARQMASCDAIGAE